MSYDTDTTETTEVVELIPESPVEGDVDGGNTMPIAEFITNFRASLLDAVRVQNPPVYDGTPDPQREALLDRLLRSPFAEQRSVIQAAVRHLVDAGQPSATINGEMGTGKTLIGIATAWLLHHAGLPRALVVCPPHLVYKWRGKSNKRCPKPGSGSSTVPDTLKKLLQLRLVTGKPSVPEFFVMGRVRMRMGFNWTPVFIERTR